MDEKITDNPGVQQDALPQLLGHPKGLFYLFFAELWERFSFYGMRALLTLYMVNHLYKDLQDGEAKGLGIYAAYGALVYFTPLIGGMIADQLIGLRKSIMLGAALMTLGHFAMAFESEFWFFTALGLLIVGNGFFKPNISSLVGTLYHDGDVRRDAGFTIFYMSINIGAALSPLVCGWLGATYGWHYGFGAAGVGMFVGLLFFYQGGQVGVFGDNGLQPQKWIEKKVAGMNIYYPIIVLSFLMVPLFASMVYFNEAVMGNLLIIVLIVTVAYITYLCTMVVDRVQAGRILVIVFITLLLTVFWSFFEQAGSSLTLFAERNVNLRFLNAAQTNSINPGYIIFLAIPFAMMWTSLSQRGTNPRTPYKYALGIAQLGLGFLLFAMSANFADEAGRVPMFFLMVGWLTITTGELFVSPIGLSKVTELAPKHMVAFFMGVFFLSSAFAHHIAGMIAKMTVVKEDAAGGQGGVLGWFAEKVTGFEGGVAPAGASETVVQLAQYTSVFSMIAFIAFVSAVIVLMVSPVIKKWMHGVH
ncbi:MAG: peptide MFS transporter [Bacteroidota bacterium]